MSDPVYVGYYTLTDAVSMPNNARFIMYDPAGPGSYNITGALLKAQILASPVVTGQLTVPAGTAALPALTTTADLNTGVYFPAADTVGIATGGVERVRISSDGYLLVNNTSSVGGYALQVTGHSYTSGNAAVAGGLIWSFGAGSWGFRNSGKTTILESSANDGTGILYLRSGNATTSGSHIVIADVYSSNVLIGTNAAPSYSKKLHVTGGVSASAGDIPQHDPLYLIGYGTGSGGTVTQATSRTTGVTLNKPTGSITLVSAAGSAAWQTFTVTNSLVSATDVPHVLQKSGTDKYMVHVTRVAAGAFDITFATTGGTTTEQPVFNFTILKGVTS